MPRTRITRQSLVAALLVFCVVLVAFWEIMHNRSRRPFEAFELTNEDFHDFAPAAAGWRVAERPVSTTAIEPNILCHQFTSRTNDSAVVARLVHGYNMQDCMRIKGYEVELVAGLNSKRTSSIEHSTSMANASHSTPYTQTWRLTSPAGDISLWLTTMLRAGDFAPTDVDVRSMAFPRVGTPDDPNWVPRGITLRSLRHPIRNLRRAIRAKWNKSRCDPLTFLGLKQPAWADENLLTLVTAGPPRSDAAAARATAGDAAIVHAHMLRQLQAWRRQGPAFCPAPRSPSSPVF